MRSADRDDTVETVRARSDIVELIGRYLKLKKVGSRYVGLCPFHAEKTPSFSVNPQKGFFHCFGCKASGDVFTFLMRMDGKTFPEALEDLANRAGVELPARRQVDPQAKERKQRQLDLLERATEFYQAALWNSEPGRLARDYLRARSLPEEVARRYRLGYAPAGWQALSDQLAGWAFTPEDGLAVGLLIRGKRGAYDMFRNRLLFPIVGLDERVHGFGARKLDPDDYGGKYINSPQGPLFDKSEILYGLPQARFAIQKSARALLVEGYFDVLSLVAAGVQETVATCGTALTEGHAQLIRRFSDRVVTAFDGDEAGRRASFRAAEELQAQDISAYMLPLPADEDPDSFVRHNGAQALAELADQARPSVEVLSDQLLAEAGQDVEARTRAVQQLLPILRACRDRVRLGAYLQLVAERFRLPERDLRGALARDKHTPVRARTDPQPQAPEGPAATPDELRLVSLLLQHPELVGQAVERNIRAGLRSAALRELVERLVADPHASTAAFLQDLADPAAAQWLAADMVRTRERTQAGAQEDLDLLLRKLRFQTLHEEKRNLEQLIQASSRQGSQEELRTLRTAKLAVDKEIQALGLAVKRVP